MKSAPGTTDFNGVKPVIEQLNSQNYLPKAANAGANTYPYFMQGRVDSSHLAMDSITGDVGGQPINKDVKVTLDLDTATFNVFNAANGGKYRILPAQAYNCTNANSIGIKAGTTGSEIYLTFKTSLIDFTQSYLLSIGIQE